MNNRRQSLKITKIEAARRQLDCAIRLFFADDDYLSVHTLGYASFRLLYDVYPHVRDDEKHLEVGDFINAQGWGNFTIIPNFLKHADKDPSAVLKSHSVEDFQSLLGYSLLMYEQLAGDLTPEMQSFHYWMKIRYPDAFNVAVDPDAEFEAIYRESIEIIKAGEWQTQLLLGTVLINFFRKKGVSPTAYTLS